jgi:copper homeostasis protein CutC
LDRAGPRHYPAVGMPTLEIPVDSVAAAELAGTLADRLEVCSDLAAEGWSPDAWLVREIRARTPANVVAMIRPRASGTLASLGAEAFRCTPAILDLCLREIEMLARAGAHGVAIGPLAGTQGVDHHACGRMIEVARAHGLEVSFLRTFDLIVDREQAARDVCELGFDRLLTAGVPGWDASAYPLHERLAGVAATISIAQVACQRLSRPALQVMPCGGIRASNAADWLKITPHLHASCRRGTWLDAQEVRDLRTAMGPRTA